MKQHNLGAACGAIACVHSVINNHEYVDFEKESILEKFFVDSLGLNAEEAAEALADSGINEHHVEAAAAEEN